MATSRSGSSLTTRSGRHLVVLVLLGAAITALGGRAEGQVDPDESSATASAPAPLDCDNWRYGPAEEPTSLPIELDATDYRRTSDRDPRPELFTSPQNHCGQMGPAADLALGLTLGSPDVVIAVLDSGIKWRDAGAMADLATQAHIDLGEAPPPCDPLPADGDCNGDGVFNISDFEPVEDRNGNGLADPEDLILDPAYSNGVDDDGDGYVDDISGWDFLYGDNNPFDTVSYGHGTGEALDSVAASNGEGSVGMCPACQFLPVRVGDSFIADGGRFAAGVLYALDQDADVIQEALGALNNPPQAQQAIDAAYRRGVVVVASMADEASQHPNLPAALEHTMAVNSVTTDDIDLIGEPVSGYLALNGCTNYGSRTFVSVPSSACSSEATGLSAGMVGLLESYARELDVDPHPGLTGEEGDNVLSVDEVLQLVRSTADDIDFSTPNSNDPANNFGVPTGNPLIDTVRYPTRPGWDIVHGYGRINTYELLAALRDGRIPPEAMIDAPLWFSLQPASGQMEVTGTVAATRSDSYDYRVEWAPGQQPPEHPATDTWTTVAEESGQTDPITGTLATIDLSEIAAALPDGASGSPLDAGLPDPFRFAVRLRVVVTAHGGDADGLVGEMQKQVFVHDDPDLAEGHPLEVPGAGTASPIFVDLDQDGTTELLLATDHGQVHALRPDGTDIDGFPTETARSPWWPDWSATATADGISPHHGAVMMGGPAVGDIDRDGDYEVVASDLNGGVTVWDHTGQVVSVTSIVADYSRDDLAAQDEYNRTKPHFYSAPALGDLDGDDDLEIVAAGADRHVYAWHHDGTSVDGFPVLVVDPDTVEAIDPDSHRVTFRESANAEEGGELIASPALADLDGDGRPEIIIGAQEQYVEDPAIGDGADVVSLLALAGSAGNSRVYAISSDGTNATVSPAHDIHPAAQAYLPGWPAPVAQASTNLLPTIGDGVAMPAAVADLDLESPGPEIVVSSSAGPLYVLTSEGDSLYGKGENGQPLPLPWTAGLDLSGAEEFGAERSSEDLVASMIGFGGPVVGDLDGEGTAGPAVVSPTAGLSRLIDLLAPDLQVPSDDQLAAWDGASGVPLAGSPQVTADLSMFVAPALADIDGDGLVEMIAGASTNLVSAHNSAGAIPAGWPKLTGGWNLGTPGVGDWDGDGNLEVAQVRRDGVLVVWHTRAAGSTPWPQFGCDLHHSGACVDTAPAAAASADGSPTDTATENDIDEGENSSPSSLLIVVGIGLAVAVGIGITLVRRGHNHQDPGPLE